MRGLGGGLNEPRDAIATGAYALLQNPTQRAQVESDPSLWRTAFEETVPWVAPIGMYPRQTMRDGARRDAHSRRRPYRRGDRVGQSRRVGFSRTLTLLTLIGPGSRMSLSAAARISARAHGPRRVLVGEVALPVLFNRLRSLRLSETEPVRFGGWVFRGPLNLPCHRTN